MNERSKSRSVADERALDTNQREAAAGSVLPPFRSPFLPVSLLSIVLQ